MIKIVIWGCRDGEHLLNEINKKVFDKYEVIAFCDNAEKFTGKCIQNIPVISFEQMQKLYANKEVERVIIAVRKGYSRYCIIKQLQKSGINRIDIVRPSVLTYKQPIEFDEKEPLYQTHWVSVDKCEKPIIHHLEINIADGCNLNCRGCLHFSNLYKRDDFPNANDLLETINEIATHCEILQFRVLGGEPLLYKELPEFLIELRKILPHSDIAVISNGILMPKCDTKLFQVMKENHIGFNLTLYEPTLKMKDLIYNTLNQNEVAYGSHEAKCEKFEKFMRLTPGSTKAFETCEPRGILVVKDKKLYRCPVEAYINKFYEEYQIDMCAPEGMNPYDETINWEKLVIDLYDEPRPLCTYCSEKSEFYEWSNGKPQMEDWLV